MNKCAVLCIFAYNYDARLNILIIGPLLYAYCFVQFLASEFNNVHNAKKDVEYFRISNSIFLETTVITNREYTCRDYNILYVLQIKLGIRKSYFYVTFIY